VRPLVCCTTSHTHDTSIPLPTRYATLLKPVSVGQLPRGSPSLSWRLHAPRIHCIMNVLCVLCASCDELLACCDVAACLHQCCLFSYVVAVFAMLSPHRCYVAQCRITTHVSLSFSLLTLPYCKCLFLWVNYPGDSTVPEQASAPMLYLCMLFFACCPSLSYLYSVLPYVSRCTHSRTSQHSHSL